MRVLLLIHGFNALSQRILIELEDMGHEVSIEFDINNENTLSAIEVFKPNVILSPYLKRAIPEFIWQKYLCLILHPGPPGDRGPTAIDWAILNNETKWGVTLLQASTQMDAGPVWQSKSFTMTDSTKSETYRTQVTEAAVEATKNCFRDLEESGIRHKTEDAHAALTPFSPAVKQIDRAINWQKDDTQTILKLIRSGDGVPGVKDKIEGHEVFLFDAHDAKGLEGKAGEIITYSGPAICRATIDGAVWIGHIKDKTNKHAFKLPATSVLSDALQNVEHIEVDSAHGYKEIHYQKIGGVGHLYFEFYNGAMSSEQCERLLKAYLHAQTQDTKIIMLHGGRNFWSNGMHLNIIEASNNPAKESWKNINAIDDLAEAIIRTKNQITIAAMHGNAGAGGVFLARACDRVWLRDGVILNPHYKDMGNLYGSEFWTYLLPKYCGSANANRISRQRLPMGAKEAVSLGLANEYFGNSVDEFDRLLMEKVEQLTDTRVFDQMIQEKARIRQADELIKPLINYRIEELEKMKRNFFGFDPSYHVARYNFVYKIPKSRTPITLARHRDQRLANVERKVS